MRNLLNPKWIFILNTTPIILLFILFIGEFNILKTSLEEEHIQLWTNFGIALAAILITNFVFAFASIIHQKKVTALYGFLALAVHILFIFFYFKHESEFIPFSLPRWMVSEELPLYVGTFIMPTLAYSLFVIVSRFTPKEKEHKAWKNFLVAIAIPISWYLFHQVILPLWQSIGSEFEFHVTIVLILVSTIAFIFFIVRTILIMARRIIKNNKGYELVWKIPVCIILPIVGLCINNGDIATPIKSSDGGLFGDFQGYWFYALAVFNGILLCLPNAEAKFYRLALFVGRTIGFSFTFYFFIVFLPFLPLSFIAIAAFGLGLLLLVPLLVFVVHINQIIKDYDFLITAYQKILIKFILILGILVLPISITVKNLLHKKTLNQALEYLYSPDYKKEYTINTSSLKKTIADIKKGKGRRNRDIALQGKLPYLTSYFNWIVLDRLTLSNDKINFVEQVFFGEEAITTRVRNQPSEAVNISDITAESSFDESQNVWTSWIDIELTNNSARNLQEYATTIDLPEGAWINNYYLYVGPIKEMGMLTEKKSAMWIYSMIRNTRKDPGILYYLTGNKVALKVYPFGAKEIRKTGIQIIHKEPIQLSIDGNQVDLYSEANQQNEIIENEHAYFISASEKNALPTVNRNPYYHFVLDVNNKETLTIQSDKIEEFRKQNGVLGGKAKITFSNNLTRHYSMDEEWASYLTPSEHQRGFYAEFGIKSILLDSYNSGLSDYPIMVMVTDNFNQAIIQKDFSDWQFAFPESEFFYVLNKDNELESHSLTKAPKDISNNSINNSNNQTRLYTLDDGTKRYLPDNNKASIVLKTNEVKLNIDKIEEGSWDSGLSMHAKVRSQMINPDPSNKEWLDQVKASFKSKIMSPTTSYIVLETEAQRARLLKKQKEMLSGHKSLDAGEDQRRMSEPELWVLALLMGVIIIYRRRKQALSYSFNRFSERFPK